MLEIRVRVVRMEGVVLRAAVRMVIIAHVDRAALVARVVATVRALGDIAGSIIPTTS